MGASFEWDPDKDAENQRKHGVSFQDAQAAFLDPERVIARDVGHSRSESRFIRIIGAGYWRRGKNLYEARTKVHE